MHGGYQEFLNIGAMSISGVSINYYILSYMVSYLN